MLLLPEHISLRHSNLKNLQITEFYSENCQPFSYSPQKNEWSDYDWHKFDTLLCTKALKAVSEEDAWEILVQGARKVLRNYSTSFFIVTRFLPLKKRQQVESIYAAVRYPDEIVDTFKISPDEKIIRLNQWEEQYKIAVQSGTLHELLIKGVPPILGTFSRVVRDVNIPHHYYLSFLEAMRLDVHPILYKNLDDLINSYIYGSAIVVGYFLAYVYGPGDSSDFQQTLDASKDLGIALQLTNFMRDINDDKKRTRIYLPLEMLNQAGVDISEIFNESSRANLSPIIDEILNIAENYYSKAQLQIEAFSRDSRPAIQACIDVYRQLNKQIRINSSVATSRHSVPLTQKFKVLPRSKYWRLPTAYLFDF